MIFEINISLVTDGDFCVRTLPDHGIVQVMDCDSDGSCYIKALLDTRQSAMDYLAKFMCELHVSFTHYWLLGELVDMFLRAISYVDSERDFYQRLCGNYEGTEIEIKIIDKIESQDDLKPKTFRI